MYMKLSKIYNTGKHDYFSFSSKVEKLGMYVQQWGKKYCVFQFKELCKDNIQTHSIRALFNLDRNTELLEPTKHS